MGSRQGRVPKNAVTYGEARGQTVKVDFSLSLRWYAGLGALNFECTTGYKFYFFTFTS